MPWTAAPAWPDIPPPTTRMATSKRRAASTAFSGEPNACSRMLRPKYSLGLFSLTVMAPSPGVSRTRATASLRRPVAVVESAGAPLAIVSAANYFEISLAVEADGDGLLRLLPVLGVRVDP